MNWIKHPTILVGERVSLLPLKKKHFKEICELGTDELIWQYSPIGVNGTDIFSHKKFLNDCIDKREIGVFYPFIIVLSDTDVIIGFTAYHSINKERKSLEIGATWLHPIYWGKGLNAECKYLMLCHCFEKLYAMRIQFRTNDNNLRSRKAIEKLGATFEGILRKDKILEDSTIRNAAIYSIIDDEWTVVKAKLQRPK